MKRELIFANDNCIGCNQCVRICKSFGASISLNNEAGKGMIGINHDRCIVCGACIDVCRHNARDYYDDTEVFFSDLEKGEEISLLVAPSFEAKYPEEYRKYLAVLKKLGVRRIIPVSLGADICTWAYLRLILNHEHTGYISTSCPAVVSYIEHWMPELLSKLMPVKSPMMCAAVYCRKQLGMKEKFAFVGPCIAKRMEMDKYPELVQYNLTFPKLVQHLEGYIKDGLQEEFPEEGDPVEDLGAGFGSYYPAPGGLADNVRWLIGDDTPVRIISGKTYLYQRFAEDRINIFDSRMPYTLFDALNCREGCIEGTARGDEPKREDRGLLKIGEIRKKSKKLSSDSPWNPGLSCEERWANMEKQFSELELSDYLTTFKDLSESCSVSYPTEAEADAIYNSMRKTTAKSRQVNCAACGYDTCEHMMISIHNGFNTRYNCVYFEKEEALYLMKMSFSDELTGVMNRNALEKSWARVFVKGAPAAIISVDVNGLKQVNDLFGHSEGDRLIIGTAKALSRAFRKDRVFRTGGDEFLVLLSDYDQEEIVTNMHYVKKSLQDTGIFIAMGLVYQEKYNGDLDSMKEAADKKMYEDKNHFYETTGNSRRT